MRTYFELNNLYNIAICFSGGSYIPHWNKVLSRKNREKRIKYLYGFVHEFLSTHKNEELINKIYNALECKKIADGNDYIIVEFQDKLSKDIFNHLAPHLHDGESYAHRDKINLIYTNQKLYYYGVYRKNN